MQELVHLGANVNKQDETGCSPLHVLASSCGHVKQMSLHMTISILGALLKKGADITLKNGDGLLAIDLLHSAEANSGDFLAAMGMHPHQAHTADTSQIKALLTPPNYVPICDDGIETAAGSSVLNLPVPPRPVSSSIRATALDSQLLLGLLEQMENQFR